MLRKKKMPTTTVHDKCFCSDASHNTQMFMKQLAKRSVWLSLQSRNRNSKKTTSGVVVCKNYIAWDSLQRSTLTMSVLLVGKLFYCPVFQAGKILWFVQSHSNVTSFLFIGKKCNVFIVALLCNGWVNSRVQSFTEVVKYGAVFFSKKVVWCNLACLFLIYLSLL